VTDPSPHAEEAPAAEATDSSATSPDAPDAPARLAMPEPTGDPLFDAMWSKVVEAWDDDKTHSAILEYALTAERLPDLAGHYRALKDHPDMGARAQKRLDAIVMAATQMMMSMKTPKNVTVPLPITLSVFGLFLAAVAFVAYAMLHRH
jgi:hypothetical protein